MSISRQLLSATIILLLIIAFVISLPVITRAQDITEENLGSTDTGAEELTIEEKGFYELESTINMKVDVASLFEEDELVVGSSVSSIDSTTWDRMGARQVYEAVNNEPGVVHFPFVYGTEQLFFRGYASKNTRCVAYLIDGMPVNNYDFGNAFNMFPKLELGILERIELIKGPGSAIYGSDAFHGVFSMKTFESDKNEYKFQGNIAYPLYGGGNAKISAGNDKIRMDFAGSGTYQGSQKLTYHYLDLFGLHPDPATEYFPPWAGTGTYKDKYESGAGSLKFRIMPTEKLTVKVGGYCSYNYLHDTYGNVYLTAVSVDPIVSARDHDQMQIKTFFTMATGAVEYRFPEKISLEASGYYWYNFKEQDSYSTAFTWDKYKSRVMSYRAGARVILKQPDNAIRLQWLVAYESAFMGIPMTSVHLKVGTPNDVLPQGLLKTSELYDEAQRSIHSAFAQFKWNAVKDILFLILGGRLDYYYNQYGLQATPRAGIIIKPAESMAIKLLYGRAFRAPAALERYGRIPVYAGNKNISPETIDIGELIYMFKFQKYLKLNVTGYYSYWRNAINYFRTTMLKPFAQSIFLNQGKNRSYGGEFTLYGNYKRWGGNAGFGYSWSEALGTINPLSQVANLFVSGYPITRSDVPYKAYPTYSVIAAVFYTIPVIEVTAHVNNRIYLDMWECTPNFDTQVTPKKLPVYYRLDLNLSRVIAEKLELIVDIRNLLNRTNYVPSLGGQEDGYVEQGISAMLRVNYKI